MITTNKVQQTLSKKAVNNTSLVQAVNEMTIHLNAEYIVWKLDPSKPFYKFSMRDIKQNVRAVATLTNGERRCLGKILVEMVSTIPNNIKSLGPNSANHQQYVFV